jgi:hypothetical protein
MPKSLTSLSIAAVNISEMYFIRTCYTASLWVLYGMYKLEKKGKL